MYGETGRMAARAEHPHGEDFVWGKVGQLDWLLDDLVLRVAHIQKAVFLSQDGIALGASRGLDQADGTAWMALFSQNMSMMALELARQNPVYLEQAQSLLENFAWIAAAEPFSEPHSVAHPFTPPAP